MQQNITSQLWEQRNKNTLQGGEKNRIARQQSDGKYTARQRLNVLLDRNSFEEIDRLACSSFLETKIYTDGVITGFGTVNGRRVAVYAQDFTIKGGSLGKRHAEKICKVMDMAGKIGCPIIGIIDSGGARIDEGIHALEGYGLIFRKNCQYSGVIPQISMILGPCAGGAVYSPALTDFIFMTEKISQMFITGPQVIEKVMHQAITKEELGGTNAHGSRSGVAHVITQTEDEAFAAVKQLLSYLPDSYLDTVPASGPSIQIDPRFTQGERVIGSSGKNSLRQKETQIAYPECFAQQNVSKDALSSLIPHNPNQAYDMKKVIDALIDNDTFFEIQENFASNILIGFARMGGMSVGLVANQPFVKAGTIDIDASCKAARFIRTCNSLGIPIVTLVDTPGYLPGVDQEHNGIIRHGAKLLYAYATATVPKITLVLRKAFGGAYIVMGSKSLGADFNFALPTSQIAVLGAKAAVTIMHGRTLTALDDETEKIRLEQKLEAEYEEDFLNPFIAAEHGYIDAIIEPNNARKHIISALQITRDKIESLPKKKHGNIPL